MNELGLGSGAAFAGARSDVGARVEALSAAVAAARGRMDDAVLDPAAELASRASERLLLSGEHTIVALAGATGSGKSSLFNRLTDLDLAGVGVRRPTTSWALACAWGPDGASELLEWMGIPPRHQVSRMSMLDPSAEDERLDGLILLDLPDHDSTEVEHHIEMDRLVRYADALVWVLDPQKYADAAIHDRYLRPLASYRDVTVVVLNQIDRIDYTERAAALEDVRHILDNEGLEGVTLIGASATRGDGLDELKRELHNRIRAKQSARERLRSDVDAAAVSLASVGGTSEIPGLTDVDREHLDGVLADAAGIPQLVKAMRDNTRRRGGRLTGWPLTRWILRRPKALGDLESGASSRLQRSQAEAAIREFAETASVGLDGPWRDTVRRASAGRADETVPALDHAVSSAGIAALRTPAWWHVANVVQWVSVVVLVAGLGWWGATELAIRTGAFTVPTDSFRGYPLSFRGYPLHLLLAVGGVVVGVGLGLLSAVANRIAGVRRSKHTDRVLRAAVDGVAEQHIIAPVRAELDAYERYRSSIIRARV
jgi:GTP-binding protein EngB required for normal cell division